MFFGVTSPILPLLRKPWLPSVAPDTWAPFVALLAIPRWCTCRLLTVAASKQAAFASPIVVTRILIIVVDGRDVRLFGILRVAEYVLHTYLIYHVYNQCRYTTIETLCRPPAMTQGCPPITITSTLPQRSGSNHWPAPVLLFSEWNTTFLDTWIQNIIFQIMKINYFRGDLTNVSAETEALAGTYRWLIRMGYEFECGFSNFILHTMYRCVSKPRTGRLPKKYWVIIDPGYGSAVSVHE